MMQNSEEQERSFECRTCDRSFARLEHLQRHLRTHTKERPYSCFCGRTFTRQDLLKRHGRRAHETCAEVSGRATPVANDISHNVASNSSTTARPSALDIQTSARSNTHQDEHQIARYGDVSEILHPDFSNTGTLDATPNGDNQSGNHLAADADHLTSMDNYLGLFNTGDLNLDWNDMDLAQTEAQDPMGIQADPGTLLFDIPVDLSAEFQDSGVSSGCDTTHSTSDISEVQARNHEQLQLAIHQHLPYFLMPSQQSIMRYLDGYVEDFNQDLPFIHLPTLALEDCSPETMLAMAAIGAYQRFERSKSHELFHASKTIALSNLRAWQKINEQGTQRSRPDGLEMRTMDDVFDLQRHTAMESLRALLLLGFYGMWGEINAITKEILDFQPLMIEVARHYGLTEHSEPRGPTTTWIDWVHEEQDRRTKLALFCFFNLQTVMHNVPSPTLCSEWQLCMPCSTEQWEAQSETKWLAVRMQQTQPMAFQDSFRALLSAVETPKIISSPNTSEFGCTILALALLQRIYYLRQLHTATGDTMGQEATTELQRAIQSLESTYTSSLGSVSKLRDAKLHYSNIMAYQDLAFVRLHADLGIHGLLQSRAPQEIARSLRVASDKTHGSVYSLLPLQRSIHQLKVAVNIGIAYVSHVSEHFSSVPQALSVLECGVFLSRWLFFIAAKGCDSSPALEEFQAIHCLQSMMKEIAVSVPEIVMPSTSTATCFELGIMVLRTWAHVLTAKIRWPLVAILGKSLNLYADMMYAANSTSKPVHLQQAR
ncbi:hypothetical protein D6C92_02435 [Aureobasidium pullulans]|nr:hypothetical protein D6C92_02435 [Aureobasidium pullulans]